MHFPRPLLLTVGCWIASSCGLHAASNDLLKSGPNLSSRDVGLQEIRLRTTPDDLDSRVKLISYYTISTVSDRRYAHVMWIIENRPASEPAGKWLVSLDPKRDGAFYHRAKRAWQRQVQRHGEDRTVLINAARFFRHEPAEVERIYSQIDELDVRAAVGEDYPLRYEYRRSKRYAEAADVFQRVFTARRDILGADNPQTLKALFFLGEVESLAGYLDQAGIHLQAFIEAAGADGQTSTNFRVALAHLAKIRLSQDKLLEAEQLCRQCHTLREKHRVDHWSLFNTKSLLGETLLRQERFVEAEPLLIDGYEGMRARQHQIGAQFRADRLRDALLRLVNCYDAWGKPEKVAEWQAELEAKFEGY